MFIVILLEQEVQVLGSNLRLIDNFYVFIDFHLYIKFFIYANIDISINIYILAISIYTYI